MTLREIENHIADGKRLSQEEEDYLLSRSKTYWEDHPDVEGRFPRIRKILAWVAGYQRYDYNTATRKLVEIPKTRKRMLTFNRLKPFVRTMLAKLVSDYPEPGVIPNTTDDDDLAAAKVGDKLLEGLANKWGMKGLMQRFKLWVLLANRAALRVYWDEEDSGITDYQHKEKLNEVGEVESTTTLEVREAGDVALEVVGPFNFRVDPLYSHDRKRWRWFLYGSEEDAEAIEEKYDLETGELKDSKDKKGEDQTALYSVDFRDDEVGEVEKKEAVHGRTVLYKEFWTPKMWAFMAGNKVLDYGVNEYKEVPFFLTEERLIPLNDYEKGIVYNDGDLKDAIPVQREYNRFKSLVSAALERATKLKVLLPLNSATKKQFTDDFGTFIDYNPAKGKAEQLRLDPIPAFVPSYTGDLQNEFGAVLSLGPSSFGQLPERASHASGSLVNLLLEQDNAVLDTKLAAINEQVELALSMALRVVQKNYLIGRLLKVTGADGQDEVKKFRGADLRGNTDVKVVTQAALPRSRALKIEYLMRLFNSKIIQDPRKILEMLELGNVEKLFDDTLVHERRAHRENMMIESQPNIEPAIVQSWIYDHDDDNIHIPIHVKFRLSVKYDKLTDNQKQALNMLVGLHDQRLAQMAQAQMQAQMQAQGQGQGQQGQAAPPQMGMGGAPEQQAPPEESIPQTTEEAGLF